MSESPSDLKAAVLHRVRQDGRRKVWGPADFLDLGSRDAVDKALQRLTTAGQLRRIDRGLYDQPGFNTLTQKPNPPDPRSVIEALGRRDQVRMLIDGMTAANDLGLTDAVPAKIVVHTDARRRALQLGNVTISFRPTAASKLYWAGRPAMRVVQALHWTRDLLGRDGEADQVCRKLRRLLNDPVTGPPLRADLLDGMTTLPTWMRVYLKTVIEDGKSTPITRDAEADNHRQNDEDGDDHRDHDRRHNHPAATELVGDPKRLRRQAGDPNKASPAHRGPRRTSNV